MKFLLNKVSENYNEERKEIDLDTLDDLLKIVIEYDKSILIRIPNYEEHLDQNYEIVVFDYYV